MKSIATPGGGLWAPLVAERLYLSGLYGSCSGSWVKRSDVPHKVAAGKPFGRTGSGRGRMVS